MNVRGSFRTMWKGKIAVSIVVAWFAAFTTTADNLASAAQSQTPAAKKKATPAKGGAKKADPKKTKATPQKAKPKTASPKKAAPKKKTPITLKDSDAAERAKLDPELRKRIDSIIGDKAAKRFD